MPVKTGCSEFSTEVNPPKLPSNGQSLNAAASLMTQTIIFESTNAVCPIEDQQLDTSALNFFRFSSNRWDLVNRVYVRRYMDAALEVGKTSYHFFGPLAATCSTTDELDRMEVSKSYVTMRTNHQQGMYASYHFALDNGEAIPEKMYFKGACYDMATRTFKGSIDWRELGINGGDASWTYIMIFSEDMKVIEGGSVVRKGADGEIRGESFFGNSSWNFEKGQYNDLVYTLEERARVLAGSITLREEYRSVAGLYQYKIEGRAVGGALGYYDGLMCIGQTVCKPMERDCKKVSLIPGFAPGALCLPKPGTQGGGAITLA